MLVVTSDGKVYYGHIGDSRIYVVANHQITQLTKDHSFVQTLVDEGKISKEQAEHHPRKNEITNALGIPDMRPPTLCGEPIEPEAGNCFVLCSDGLSGMIDDQHIEHIVSKHEINIQQRARNLVEMANEAGGKDNITVQLVEFAVSTKKEETKNKGSNKKLFLAIGLAIAAILAVLLIAYFVFLGKNKTRDSSEIDNNSSGETSQDAAISNETISVLYIKGSSSSVEPRIPENEQIDDSKVIKGEQFVKEIRTEGRYIIIQWPDKDFSDTDLNEEEIEISLTTDNRNEYIRRIKVLTSEQEPNSPASPPTPPVQTPTPPLVPTPAPPSAPAPTPAPSGESQGDIDHSGEESKTGEQGSKGE
jgi:hypothetical protein